MTDLSVRLLRDGYRALDHMPTRTDARAAAEARLLGRRAVVVAGEAGARVFYDESVVRRAGAVPKPLARLLFGRGAVHGLDGDAHRVRKAGFVDRLGHDQVAGCAALAGDHLRSALAAWPASGRALHAALVEAYGRAVLEWAGVAVQPEAAVRLARRYAAIVDGFGFAGPAYARAWRERVRTDRWAARLVADVRAGRVEARSGTHLAAVAALDAGPQVAGVELGNVVRPAIAVSWLGTFAAAALAASPSWAPRLAGPDGAALRWSFAQEVRRTAPFVPALAGRVRRATALDGVELRPGDRIVLDVLGIDHDPAYHPMPQVFDPERFLDRQPDAWTLVPQGGGPVTGHRCPGEDLTLQLLAETLRVLAEGTLSPTAPLTVDLARIPTLPVDGLPVRWTHRTDDARTTLAERP